MRMTFDRGTVLLTPTAAGESPEGWPGVMWDPRVTRWRAPAWRRGELLRRCAQEGLAVEGRVGEASRWRVYPWPLVSLRSYQGAALCAWRLAGRRGIVALPTGSGKTWVALGAMAEQAAPTLCVVPTRVLMHQWWEAISRLYPGPVGLWGDGKRRLYPVTVTTFESAYRHMATWGDRFSLLVVDEAHHFGQSAQDSILQMCAARARLGLTATPPGPGPRAERLHELLGAQVFSTKIEELRGKHLADFQRISLVVDFVPEERRGYDLDYGAFRSFYLPFRRRSPEASWVEFVREASRSDDGRRALAAWRASRRRLGYHRAKAEALRWLLSEHSQRKVLIFTPDNETAYKVASEHLVMPITCDIGRAERARCLEHFRAGRLRRLVSSRVLNEGLDVPDAEVGIIVGGGGSLREYLQRLGRILRPARGKMAVLVELTTRATPESRRFRQREMSLGESLPAVSLRGKAGER